MTPIPNHRSYVYHPEERKIKTPVCVTAAIALISLLAIAILTALACSHLLPFSVDLCIAPLGIVALGALITLVIFESKKEHFVL